MVAMLPWVKNVKVTMSAQPARPIYAEQLPAGLQTISNISKMLHDTAMALIRKVG